MRKGGGEEASPQGGGRGDGEGKRAGKVDSEENEGANHDHGCARLGAAALRYVPGVGVWV